MIERYILPLGLCFIFLGVFLVIISSFLQSDKTESKVAVGGIIGFIPFGFANDKKLLWFVISLTAVLFVFWAVISYLWR
jgi:uncharacterized membrane protein